MEKGKLGAPVETWPADTKEKTYAGNETLQILIPNGPWRHEQATSRVCAQVIWSGNYRDIW